MTAPDPIEQAVAAIRTATVIKPGDRVLLTSAELTDTETINWMLNRLGDKFDAEFVLAAPVSDVAIVRADEPSEPSEAGL